MKEYPDKTPSFHAYPPHAKTMHTRNINQRLCNKHVYLFTKQNELFFKKKKKILYLAFSKMHQKSSGCNCVQLYFCAYNPAHITMVKSENMHLYKYAYKGSMQCQRLVAFWVQLTVSLDVSCNIANILTLHFAINKFKKKKNLESILLYTYTFWKCISYMAYRYSLPCIHNIITRNGQTLIEYFVHIGWKNQFNKTIKVIPSSIKFFFSSIWYELYIHYLKTKFFRKTRK